MNRESSAGKPDYGVDAPGVIRNLTLFGCLGLALWASVALHFWRGVLDFSIGGVRFLFPLAGAGLWSAVGLLGMATWMLWSSKVGKARGREKLLDRIPWTGREQVLDVGCGRGLMLVGAARRLSSGSAVGIDIWQAEDLSGNRPEAAVENARREGVAARVEVKTADMRDLPFADGTFDVVLSCSAIHNLYKAKDRARAIGEIARVLKSGGRALIDDIRHGHEYAALFAKNACPEIERIGSPLASALLTALTFGSLRPTTLLVRKES